MKRVVTILMAMAIAASPVAGRPGDNISGWKQRLEARADAVEAFTDGADGVRLFYRRVGRGRETILFLHGGPGSNFRGSGDFMERFAGRRTLIMYDQRGSGRSEIVSDPARLTVGHHLRDIEALRRRFGIRRMTVIGLSWGAGLAALYAAKHPERIDRLLLISPMPPTRAHFEQRTIRLNSLLGDAAVSRRADIARKLADADDRATAAFCRELSDIVFRLYLADPTPEKLDHAARRCAIPPAAIRNRPIVEAATLASMGEWDFRQMLSRLHMPALVLEGADTNVPLDATRVWATVMPNARLRLIPDAGHECFLDQPGSFEGAVEQFLRAHSPEKGR